MKFNFLIFVFPLLFFKMANAQNVTIPDAEFVKFLTSRYPTCMSSNSMNTKCAEIVNTKQIDVFPFEYNIYDFSGIEHFVNLESLRIFLFTSYMLESLPHKLATLSLTSATGAGNGLISLAANLPPALTTLNLSDIGAEFQLPAILPNLKTLYIRNCPNINRSQTVISSLPIFPDSLTSLTLSNINRTTFNTIPPLVKTLDLSNNNLIAIPTIPSGITAVDLSKNNLITIPTLPSGITYLNLSNNKLSSIPQLVSQQFNYET